MGLIFIDSQGKVEILDAELWLKSHIMLSPFLLALILGILLHCSPINFLSWKDVLKTTLLLEVGYWHAAGLGQISE